MSGKGKTAKSGGSGSNNPKPGVGATGGKPSFYQDCVTYGVKPYEDGATEFWHSLNREFAKADQAQSKGSATKKK